jgi:alkaline phosphatase
MEMNFLNCKQGRLLAIFCLLAAVVAFTQTPQVAVADNTQSNAKVKNVILMIADGCGHNCFEATDYYQYGAKGAQVYEHFPTQVSASTYEFEYLDYTPATDPYWGPWFLESGKYVLKGYDTNQFWSDMNYPIWIDTTLGNPLTGWYVNNNTDSASSATAMATGFKTKDGAIGYAFPLDADGNLVVDAEGKSYTESKPNIVEYAESLGKATGVISSVPLSHATPAGFVAHNESRANTVAIANEMLYQSKVDVIMTPASPDYQDNGAYNSAPSSSRIGEYLGATAFADMKDGFLDNPNNIDANHDGVSDSADRFVVIRDKSQFEAYAEGATPARVFGLPKVRRTLQYYRDGDKTLDPFAVPFIPDMPTLADMTKAALNVLDDDQDGFFLMIEGGAADWANHSGQGGRMIEEMIDFNHSVEAVVDWVQKNSNWGETLVIVTADHETGFLWGPDSCIPPAVPGGSYIYNDYYPLVNNGVGVKPGMQYCSPIGWHSNSLVPVFAKGDAARLFKGYAVNDDLGWGPYIDNTDIFKIIKYSMGNYAAKPGKGKGK